MYRLRLVSLFFLVACVVFLASRPNVAMRHRAPVGGTVLARLPLSFIANHGQWDAPTCFVAHSGAHLAKVERTAFAIGAWAGDGYAAVRLVFEAAAATTAPVGERPREARYHFFCGRDPTRWRHDVAGFAAIRWDEMWPGIAVRLREREAGLLEYDLLLAPGADLERAVIRCEGGGALRLAADGSLIVVARSGELRQLPPVAWQVREDGSHEPVSCRYRRLDRDRFGFVVAGRDPRLPLVLDPATQWATFLGGSQSDDAFALAVDAAGNITVAGSTTSSGFPVTKGAHDTSHNGLADVIVARLSAAGDRLQWATFLGGSGAEEAYGLGLDASGAVVVGGYTLSKDFPATSGAFDTSFHGVVDGFVAKLAANGDRLQWATYLGGSGYDFVDGLALDPSGDVIVAGTTASGDFPATSGAYDTIYNGGRDGFVARLAAAGNALAWSTYLGGSGDDGVRPVALETAGLIVAGTTASSDFPVTTGAYDTVFNGSQDVFVASLTAKGDRLRWASFLGADQDDYAHGLALDAGGSPIVVGETASTAFPITPGCFDATYNGGRTDAFVSKLSPAGNHLVWSTFLGGSEDDGAWPVVLAANGAVVVGGYTWSAGFPVTAGAFRTGSCGLADAFVTEVAPSGAFLHYSTFLGGTQSDAAICLALDAEGAAIVAGYTYSADFPVTSGAYDVMHNGYYDAFVGWLDRLPTGVRAFGRSSPGCEGKLPIGVTEMPKVGSPSLAFTCGRAPPSSAGIFAISAGPLLTGLPVLGVELWLDPFSAAFVVFPAMSWSTGAAYFPVPVPRDPGLAGLRFCTQFFWVGPSSPAPCPRLGLSATGALQVTIQP